MSSIVISSNSPIRATMLFLLLKFTVPSYKNGAHVRSGFGSENLRHVVSVLSDQASEVRGDPVSDTSGVLQLSITGKSHPGRLKTLGTPQLSCHFLEYISGRVGVNLWNISQYQRLT